MSDIELKPCPFCGSEAVKTYNTQFGYQVYCENTDCILNELVMRGKETERESIEAWNNRTPST